MPGQEVHAFQGDLCVQSLQNEFQARQEYISRLCLKNNQTRHPEDGSEKRWVLKILSTHVSFALLQLFTYQEPLPVSVIVCLLHLAQVGRVSMPACFFSCDSRDAVLSPHPRLQCS